MPEAIPITASEGSFGTPVRSTISGMTQHIDCIIPMRSKGTPLSRQSATDGVKRLSVVVVPT